MDVAALRDRVFVAHQHDEAAAFAGEEAVRLLVVHPHALLRERRALREADQLERIEREIDAARERDVEVAVDERVARVDDREQRRRARAVDGVAAAVEAEVVADASGDRVRQSARERVFADLGERRVELLLELLQRLGVDARGDRGAAHVRPAQAQRSARELSPVSVLPTMTPVPIGGGSKPASCSARSATSSASQCARSADSNVLRDTRYFARSNVQFVITAAFCEYVRSGAFGSADQ